MHKAPEKIDKLVRELITALGYELVEIEMVNKGSANLILRVYIDHEKGITLNDCSIVSNQLSGVLDVADVIAHRYELEISSPGLNRPLVEMPHFQRFQGHKARIALKNQIQGQRKFNGILAGIDGNEVLMQEGETLHRFPLHQIETARLIPSY